MFVTSIRSKETIFFQVVDIAAKYANLWFMGEIFNPHEFELNTVLLEAQKTGLSKEAIKEAIALGESRSCWRMY